MLKKPYELGVVTSYSRPRVSNDNPFAESLFKTCKYRPNWPTQGFESLNDARRWVLTFTRWYNYEHKHSQLRFVTPNQRHTGEDVEILAQRKMTMDLAKAENPIRWGSKEVRNCSPVGPTTLNPVKEQKQDKLKAA
jgi:putative transposase